MYGCAPAFLTESAIEEFGNIILENEERKNQRLELTDKDAHYFLGPNLILSGCTLILKVPASRLFLDRVQFIDCTFEVQQELKNHQQWIKASLKGCRFKGRLTGCDFGHWPDYGDEPGHQYGAIDGCDFTEARMDGCRIMGGDPHTLLFPKWPCFTLLDPVRRASELRDARWPGLFGRITVEGLATQPSSTRALTYHAPSVARRMGTTEEELKNVIERLDGIVY